MFEACYSSPNVTLKVASYQGMPFVHCKVKKMAYKEIRALWEELQEDLKEEHPVVFSCIPEGDKKLYRFQEMFGMTEAVRDNGQILFFKEL